MSAEQKNSSIGDERQPSPASYHAPLLLAAFLFVLGVLFWQKRASAPTARPPTRILPSPADIDPALIAYAETGAFAVGFAQPVCLALAGEDEIAVAGDQALRFFDRAGAQKREIALPGKPTCIAAADGRLYVGFGSEFFILDFSGAIERRAHCGARAVVSSIAALAGKIYVADSGAKKIHVFSPDGSRIGELAGQRNGDDGLVIYQTPLAIAAGDDGLLRVTDPGRHRLKIYAPDGTLVDAWPRRPSLGLDGFCGCCNPAYIALLPGGRVVTSESKLPRIKVHSAGGDFISAVVPASAFAGAEAQPIAAWGETIFVLDLRRQRVRIFSPPCRENRDTSETADRRGDMQNVR